MTPADREVLDPVCGMRLGPLEGLARPQPQGSVPRFCSALCMRAFLAAPERSDPERWIDVMRHTIAINASFFDTHCMVQQYAASA